MILLIYEPALLIWQEERGLDVIRLVEVGRQLLANRDRFVLLLHVRKLFVLKALVHG